MLSIHDNEILSYKIDLKNKMIKIHTQKEITGNIKNIDIIFYDVLAHYFENELSGSILLDMCKYDISSFIKDNESLLKHRKGNCWPIWYKTIDELKDELNKEQYHYYTIEASYGLSGWVLSKQYEIKENN